MSVSWDYFYGTTQHTPTLIDNCSLPHLHHWGYLQLTRNWLLKLIYRWPTLVNDCFLLWFCVILLGKSAVTNNVIMYVQYKVRLYTSQQTCPYRCLNGSVVHQLCRYDIVCDVWLTLCHVLFRYNNNSRPPGWKLNVQLVRVCNVRTNVITALYSSSMVECYVDHIYT